MSLLPTDRNFNRCGEDFLLPGLSISRERIFSMKGEDCPSSKGIVSPNEGELCPSMEEIVSLQAKDCLPSGIGLSPLRERIVCLQGGGCVPPGSLQGGILSLLGEGCLPAGRKYYFSTRKALSFFRLSSHRKTITYGCKGLSLFRCLGLKGRNCLPAGKGLCHGRFPHKGGTLHCLAAERRF